MADIRYSQLIEEISSRTTNAIRISQLIREVASTKLTINLRYSQQAIEVATLNFPAAAISYTQEVIEASTLSVLPDIRMSQLVIEAASIPKSDADGCVDPVG